MKKSCLYFAYTILWINVFFKIKQKNEGIIILLNWGIKYPQLPLRVFEVFMSVIVTHPSSVHSELITAYEKWLVDIMSASPPSNQLHTPLWNSDSQFIPLHCLFSTSYILILSHFHVTNPSFPGAAPLILVKHWRPKIRWLRLQRPQAVTLTGNRCRIAVGVREESLTELQNTLIALFPEFHITHDISRRIKRNTRFHPRSAAARQLSSSIPASVYKQSHSCWHWHCICREVHRKPRLTPGIRWIGPDPRPGPIHLGGICHTYVQVCLQF